MNRGFSLLEVILVTGIFALVAGGLARTLYQGQEIYAQQNERAGATADARVAVDVIARYLREAGNDPHRHLELNDLPGIEFDSSTQTLRTRSDITGSVASTTGDAAESSGDPDGALNSIHEDVVVTLQGTNLMIDVGYGPEVLAQDVEFFGVAFFDRLGNPVTGPASASRAVVNIVSDGNMALRTHVFLKRSTLDLTY